ncbi:MAG: ABC transporter substrate-binding protein, partial [Deltaproteobacteria bacterium]
MRRGMLAVFLILAVVASAAAEEPERLRIVSLNPSLTEILLSLDAADTLVGVDDYSARQQPSVAELPRVGGLF